MKIWHYKENLESWWNCSFSKVIRCASLRTFVQFSKLRLKKNKQKLGMGASPGNSSSNEAEEGKSLELLSSQPHLFKNRFQRDPV